MRILVFNGKGGCGKSLVAREVIAAPKSKQTTIVEIDELNRTQSTYRDKFEDVITLTKEDFDELFVHLNTLDNLVIDVGADSLTATIKAMTEHQMFDQIERVVIPVAHDRTAEVNALKAYAALVEHCPDIYFVIMDDNESSLEKQHESFFANVESFIPDFNKRHYVTLSYSRIFKDAMTKKKLVTELAEDIDYKSAALNEKAEGNHLKCKELLKKEFNKRAAQHLMINSISPAHDILTSAR